MLRKWKHCSMVALVTALLAGALSVPGAAAGLGFTAEALHPENQVKNVVYFDLKVEPGQSQELRITVTNKVEQDLTLEVEANNASTAADGNIDYTTKDIRDESLLYPFADLVELEQETLTLAPGEVKDIVLKLQAPPQAFDGQIIGGIVIRQLPGTEDAATAGEGEETASAIQNIYQYALPVVLQQNENPVEADFELVEIEPTLLYGRASVIARLRNKAPLVTTGGKMHAELFEEGATEPYFVQDSESFQMAPNSIWEVQFIDRAGEGFPAGNYNLKMQVEFDGKTWDYDEPFTIEKEQAEEINNQAVNQGNQQNIRERGGGFKLDLPVWVIVSIAVGGVVILLIIIIMLKIRKNNKEYERFVAEHMKKLKEQED